MIIELCAMCATCARYGSTATAARVRTVGPTTAAAADGRATRTVLLLLRLHTPFIRRNATGRPFSSIGTRIVFSLIYCLARVIMTMLQNQYTCAVLVLLLFPRFSYPPPPCFFAKPSSFTFLSVYRPINASNTRLRSTRCTSSYRSAISGNFTFLDVPTIPPFDHV